MAMYAISVNNATGMQTYGSFIVSVCEHLLIYTSIFLLFSIVVTSLFNTTYINSSKFKVLYNISKAIMISFGIFLLAVILVKMFFNIYLLRNYGEELSTLAFVDLKLKFILPDVTFYLNGSLLSDVILLLALSSGYVSLTLLGDRKLSNHVSNVVIFFYFFFVVVVMVYTANLLVMFLAFEFLFFPTLYFVFSQGYVKKADRALLILFRWTLGGAFLVLLTLAYLYFKFKTLNVYSLSLLEFTENEKRGLFFAIFIGFGVKVPVFPFHYWLTKIHVEAPAGFSIFLSGFLVKAALYCFYLFSLILQCDLMLQTVALVSFWSVLEASIKLWTQLDFKKLIAFATIQEMNLILYLLVNLNTTISYSLLVFILVHGWLSTLMFLMVDIIQKKTSTRNLTALSGFAYTFVMLRYIIWLIIILFSGFPLTVKFAVEWQIMGALASQSAILMLVLFFTALVAGTVGFAKQMLLILYGLPRTGMKYNTVISKRDIYWLYFIASFLVVLSLVNFCFF